MSKKNAAFLLIPLFLLLIVLYMDGFFTGPHSKDLVPPEEGRLEKGDLEERDNALWLDIQFALDNYIKDSNIEIKLENLDDGGLGIEIVRMVDLDNGCDYNKAHILQESKEFMAELFKAESVKEIIVTGNASRTCNGVKKGDIIYMVKAKGHHFPGKSVEGLDIKEFEEYLDELWIHEEFTGLHGD